MEVAHLTTRVSDTGLEIRGEVTPYANGCRPDIDAPWVIFVHGATVDVERAEQQAKRLFNNAAARLGKRATPVLFTWPATSGPSRMKSRVDYPLFVPRATESGKLLGSYLARHKRFGVTVMGQSLGALVVLEAARTFQRDTNGQRLPSILLTGAAVETANVEDHAIYGQTTSDREVVLFSETDIVLRVAFTRGQHRAHPAVPATEAVGLRGRPRKRWEHHGPPQRTSERMDSRVIDHAYWRQAVAAEALHRVHQGWTLEEPPHEPLWRRLPWLGYDV